MPANASVIVANLRTPEKYFDHFQVELHTDNTGNALVATQIAKGSWDPTLERFTQTDAISFEEGYESTTYYLRARVIDIVGNQSAWSAWANGTTPLAPIGGPVDAGSSDPSLLAQADPANFYLRDDFTVIGSDSQIGELDWDAQGDFFASASVTSGPMPRLGIVHLPFAFTAPDAQQNLMYSGWQRNAFKDLWALFDYPGWKMTWIFCFRNKQDTIIQGESVFSLAKVRFYIGLFGPSGVSGGADIRTRPYHFAGLRYDTDTYAEVDSAIGDSTFKFECVANPPGSSSASVGTGYQTGCPNNVGGNTYDTGIVPQEGHWYRLDIKSLGRGRCHMSLNGSTPVELEMPLYSAGDITSPSNGWSILENEVLYVPLQTTPDADTGKIAFGPPCWVGGSIVDVEAGEVLPNPASEITPHQQVATHGTKDWTEFRVFPGTPDEGGGTITGNLRMQGYPAMKPGLLVGSAHSYDTDTDPLLEFGLGLDFFSLEWNAAIFNGAAATDETLSRFWAPSIISGVSEIHDTEF